MGVQLTSDLVSDRDPFTPLTAEAARFSQGDEGLAYADARGEDRERRRMEFRASLMKARAAFELCAGARCLTSPS
jgi:hypothetical protein